MEQVKQQDVVLVVLVDMQVQYVELLHYKLVFHVNLELSLHLVDVLLVYLVNVDHSNRLNVLRAVDFVHRVPLE